jgi:tetratricopeptide (TPR) repeat protein
MNRSPLLRCLGVACALLMASVPILSEAQQKPAGLSIELQDAATLLHSRQYPVAIQTYEKILKTHPQNEKAAIGLATAYYGVYNYDQMRRVLRQAAAAHPTSPTALVELGKLDIQLLHYDDAIVELQRAVRRAPASSVAQEQLGVAYQAKGDEEKALVHLNEAVRLAPGSASAHYFRGSLFSDRNDNDRAYQDAKDAHRLGPNLQTEVLLAKTALHANQCDESIALLQPLADSGKAEPAELYLLSRAYKCAGQADRAQQLQDEYEKQSQKGQDLKTHKMHADHLATDAGELARKNQLSSALTLLNQALSEDPDNGPSLAQLAKIDFSRGDVSRAEEEIHHALRDDPYNPDYLYVLGKVLEISDPPGALAAFQRTVLVNPKESDAYYEMGAMYLKMGDRKRAADAFGKAVQLSPEDTDYKKALADLRSNAR